MAGGIAGDIPDGGRGGGSRDGESQVRVINTAEAHKGRRPHDPNSSEDDEDSMLFEGDERSSFTHQDFNDGSDDLHDKINMPR
jgi:hypothetical protein